MRLRLSRLGSVGAVQHADIDNGAAVLAVGGRGPTLVAVVPVDVVSDLGMPALAPRWFASCVQSIAKGALPTPRAERGMPLQPPASRHAFDCRRAPTGLQEARNRSSRQGRSPCDEATATLVVIAETESPGHPATHPHPGRIR